MRTWNFKGPCKLPSGSFTCTNQHPCLWRDSLTNLWRIGCPSFHFQYGKWHYVQTVDPNNGIDIRLLNILVEKHGIQTTECRQNDCFFVKHRTCQKPHCGEYDVHMCNIC
jgi:hypothetical protein